MNGDELILGIELCEAKAWADFYRGASRESVEMCGVSVDYDDDVVMVASMIDVLAFNRSVAFGVKKPATMDRLDAIIARYRDEGVPRFFVQRSPRARPAELTEWLEEKGLTFYNRWVKLYRDIEEPCESETELEIRRIGLDHADDFGRLVVEAFDWPRLVARWIGDSVGRRNWCHYLAFDGEKPVATAALYLSGEFGWLDFASTLDSHRGRGAQNSLTAVRVRDAREAGCRILCVETAVDRQDHPSPSYRNMRRLGFQVAYERDNYLGIR